MKALIAEDETILANNIKICLENEVFEKERFHVDIAENGAVALRLLQDGYDLVILDLKMPELHGKHIINAINLIEPHKRPWVVLITAHPDDHEMTSSGAKWPVQALLKKPFELPDLMGVIRELVKSRHQILDSEKRGVKLQCNWALVLTEIGTAFIQVNGLLNFADTCSLPWAKLDSLVAGQQAEVAGAMFNTSGALHRFRKFQAKAVGGDLFEKLFVGNIHHSFVAAASVVFHSHDLQLTFVGPRHYLNLPLEFLNDGTDYLILRHPMKRVITGVRFRRNAGLSDLLSELQDRREKLRILLVASNTRPAIDSVDEEVAVVYDWLKTSLPSDRFVIDYLPTEKATYDEVMTRLKGCNYHILHYAGHGHHDQGYPERSSLFLWEKSDCQGDIKSLSVNSIKNTLLMKGHELRFIYLSCCFGIATSSELALLNDNFLGIADGLILAGVPSVLGFRWPVSDAGAKELALTFYESLFNQGNLETALFNARCKVAGSEEGLEIGDWLSPILIVQG